MRKIKFLVKQSTGMGDIKEGQIISVENDIAKTFVERGIAVFTGKHLIASLPPIHQKVVEEADSLVDKPAAKKRKRRKIRYTLDEY